MKKTQNNDTPPICDSCGSILSEWEIYNYCLECVGPPLCGDCNGSGEGPADGTRCQNCKGSGVLKIKKEYDI